MIKKIIILTLVILLTFIAGLSVSFYLHAHHSFVGSFLSRIFQQEPLPLNVKKKFNDLIYYATERDLKNNTLNYGTVQLQVPITHQLGDSLTFDMFKSIEPLSEADFFAQLKKRADKPLIIWVHGFNTSFNLSTAFIGQIATDLNLDATFLMYDWDSKATVFNYQQDFQQLTVSADHFVTFLNQISNQVKPKKMIIIAHSLGTRLVSLVFQKLYQDPKWRDPEIEFSNVIFIAPNLDFNDFNKNFKREITSMVKRLTVYVASDDNALLLAKLLYNINSLGLPQKFDPNTQLDEIQSFLSLEQQLPNSIDLVDVSYLTKKGASKHLYFKERPVLEDLNRLLSTDHAAHERYLLKYSAPNVTTQYWFIPP